MEGVAKWQKTAGYTMQNLLKIEVSRGVCQRKN